MCSCSGISTLPTARLVLSPASAPSGSIHIAATGECGQVCTRIEKSLSSKDKEDYRSSSLIIQSFHFNTLIDKWAYLLKEKHYPQRI
jgi:hypothetical protein